MTERDFAKLEKELERTLSDLKGTTDAKRRRSLLLQLRRLLAEADRLLESAD